MVKSWQEIPRQETHFVSCYVSPAAGSVLCVVLEAIPAQFWDGESPVPVLPPTLEVRLLEAIPGQVRQQALTQRVKQVRRDPALAHLVPMRVGSKVQQVPTPPDFVLGSPALMPTTPQDWYDVGGMTTRVGIADTGNTLGRQGGGYSVPRALLAGPMLQAFREERVHIDSGQALAGALVDELRSFDPVKVPELWHTTPQDLLSLSLALSCWWITERRRHSSKVGKLIMG
jgi:hypothetical protein